jgi:hypothetical protein
VGKLIRNNLSSYKGMNVETFAHASNELTKCINLKQTENGLEMRNGAKTLLEYNDYTTQILSEIYNGLLDLSATKSESLTVDLSGSSLINIDYSVNPPIVSGISNLFDIFDEYQFNIIENNNSMFSMNGEYISKRTDNTIFQSGYFPYGVCVDMFETNFNNIMIVNQSTDGIQETNIVTLHPNIAILLDDSGSLVDAGTLTTMQEGQSLSVWEYNPDMKSIMGGLYVECSAKHATYDNINKHLIKAPHEITYETGNILRLKETGSTTEGITDIVYENGVPAYDIYNVINRTTPTINSKTFIGKANGIYYIAVDGTTDTIYQSIDSVSLGLDGVLKVASITNSANTQSMFVAILATKIIVYKFIKGSPSVFTKLYEITGEGITDVIILYHTLDLSNATMVDTGKDKNEYISILVKETAGINNYIIRISNVITESVYSYTTSLHSKTIIDLKLTYANMTAPIYSTNEFYNNDINYNFSYNTILCFYSTTNYIIYSMDIIYDNSYDTLYTDATAKLPIPFNIKVLDEGNLSVIPFRSTTQTIKSIAINNTPCIIPLNRHNPVLIRPFFGYSNKLTATVPSIKTIDLYTVPILPYTDVPINLDSPSKLNCLANSSGTAAYWNQWLLYSLPTPVIDLAANELKLCKGGYNTTNGYYEVKALSYNPTDDSSDIAIEKRIANNWNVDSVTLYSFDEETAIFGYKSYNSTDYPALFEILPGNTGTTHTGISSTASDTVIATVSGKTDQELCGIRTKVPSTVTNDLPLQLTADKQYILSMEGMVNIVAGETITVSVFETGYDSHKGLSLQEEVTLTGSFKKIEFNFTALYTDKTYTIWIDTSKSNGVYTFKNIKLVMKKQFDADTSWSSYNQEKFVAKDYNEFAGNGIYIDELKNSIYYTAGGILYTDKGNAVIIDKPLKLAVNNVGVYVASLAETWLIQGYTPDSISKTKILNYGLLNEFDKYGLNGLGDWACLYNEAGLFLFGVNGVENIGKPILPYLKLAGNRYAAIDKRLNKICIPIQIDALEEDRGYIENRVYVGDMYGIHIDPAGTNRDIHYKTGFAYYDINRKAWTIYGYNTDAQGLNFIKYSKTYNDFIGWFGDILVDDVYIPYIGLLEVDDYTETQSEKYPNNPLYTHETWDKILIQLTTREQSFTGDPTDMLKIKQIGMDNMTIKPYNTNATPDYLRVRFYQHFNTYSEAQNLLKEYEKIDGYNYNSFMMPVDVNLYTGAIDITIARTADSKNPKIIFKDLLIDIISKGRKRSGGY